MSRADSKDWEPQDIGNRGIASGDLDRSLCVEAGAGTGKTTLLINRMIEIIRRGGRLDRLAAITFTEKAAGELKLRLREKIEDEYAEAKGPARELMRKARRDIDRAQISTIHAFASGLLRMRPVEAEVDPEFIMMDALGAELFFDETWEDWLAEQLDSETSEIRRSLLLGASLDGVKSLAKKIYDNRDVIRESPDEPEYPDTEGLFLDLKKEVESLSAFAEDYCSDKSDRGYLYLKKLERELNDLNRLSQYRREAHIYRYLKLTGQGNKKNWKPASACDEQKNRIKDLSEELEEYRCALGQASAQSLLEWIKKFIEYAGEKKKVLGALDFQDLLILARNLLRDNPGVRRYFQSRFDYVLVDEFQDTDPLQAELVFFLCEDGANAADWKDVVIKPGKLFIVSDPKQSIYGFRRADLDVYNAVKQLLQGDPVRISQNFRSSPSIIDWINAAFSKIIDPSNRFQPEYEPLLKHPDFKDGLDHSSVILLPSPREEQEMKDLNAEQVREMEAEAISGMVQKAVSEGWPVRRHGINKTGIGYGDIAVLFPRSTDIKIYQDSLERKGIPYRLEGGKQFFERDEVRSLRACLKAIADPEDQLALVAALRSFFFGVSDDELMLFHSLGGKWNYLTRREPNVISIAEAFDTLRELHYKRHERSFALTIEDLAAKTCHRHLRILWPGGRQAVFNMDKVIGKARAFEAQGAASFARFAEWLERMELEEREESEMPRSEDQENIVSLLTIHKAKGLEFPLVLLANLSSGRGSSRGGTVIVDRINNSMEFGLGEYMSSPGFSEALEVDKEKAASEERRLLYVACTRAKDYLVIPYFTNKPGSGCYGIFAESLLGPGEVPAGGESRGIYVIDTLSLPVTREEPRYTMWQTARKRDQEAVESMMSERESWIAEDERLRSAAAEGLMRTKPSRLFEEERPEEMAGAAMPRDAALAIGSMVHEALERIDPSRPDDAERLAGELAREAGMQEKAVEVQRLVKTGLESSVFKRAVKSRRMLREVPYTFFKSGREISSGKIDLVFEEDDRLVIVDYKTGRADYGNEKELPDRYRVQGREYKSALEALSGRKVKEVIFLFLDSGREIRL